MSSSEPFLKSMKRTLDHLKKLDEPELFSMSPIRRERPIEEEEEDESHQSSHNEAVESEGEDVSQGEQVEGENVFLEEDGVEATIPAPPNNIAALMALGYTWENATEADEKEKASKREKETLRKNKPKEALKALKEMSFLGTCYPHKDTMDELGIRRDVEILFGSCGMSKFVTLDAPAYQIETLHFLASVQIHYYDQNVESLMRKEGGGYITFSIRKDQYRMTIKDVQNVFGFFDGTNFPPNVAKEEVERVWQMIAGPNPYTSSRSKSSRIRNPAISYMRRALANTFFARAVTGTVTSGEMKMMVMAIKDTIGDTDDGTALEGDVDNGGLATCLLVHLSLYRDWAATLCKKGSSGTLCVGGIVTPILDACGVEIKSTRVEPRYMEFEYLKRIDFLANDTVNGRYLYKFHHPQREVAQILLPCIQLTSIRMGDNISFIPPLESLYDPNAPPPQEDDSSDPEKYLYEEMHTSKQGTGLKSLQKNVSFLKKANKWLVKKVKGLVKTNEHLEARINVLERRDAGPSFTQQSPEREELPRRHSVSNERPQAPTQPRHSSAGFNATLQYRRRVRGPTNIRSSGPLDHLMLERPSSPRNTQDSSATLDRPMLEWSSSSHQPVLSIEPLDQAEPEHVPNYTLDSMNASTAHFFDFE